MMLLISKIKPEDEKFTEYEFSVDEFCDISGIGKSGKNYNHIKKVISELREKSRWIEFDDDTETLVSWIIEPSIKKKSGKIRLYLSPALQPYLTIRTLGFRYAVGYEYLRYGLSPIRFVPYSVHRKNAAKPCVLGVYCCF